MNEAKATRFQRRRRRTEVWAWAASAASLAAVAFTPLSGWLRDWAWRLASSFPAPLAPAVALTMFVAALVLLWEVSALPALASRSAGPPVVPAPSQVEHIVMGALGGAVVAFVAAVVASAIVNLAAQFLGGWWWAGASLAAALTLLLALKVGPQMLARLARVQPLSRPSLVRAVAAVAEVARVPVAGVHEWHVGPGSHASALITGIGHGRRVLVASELVRDWSDDEVAVVVAHELGHVARHDLARAVVLNAVILATGLGCAAGVLEFAGPWLGVSGPADLAALPPVAVVAGACWAACTPFRHAQSRRQERHADAFALACTGEAEAFASALRRLSAQRLVEDRPSRLTTWFFHGHPSVAERLAVAEQYARLNRRDEV